MAAFQKVVVGCNLSLKLTLIESSAILQYQFEVGDADAAQMLVVWFRTQFIANHLEANFYRSFFSYYESESLHPTPEEQRTIEVCFKMIRNQLRSKPDNEHLGRIIIAYLELILEYCAGFYERQFKTEITADNDLLKRFDDLLKHYYSEGRQRKLGLPTVRYCAQELFLSPNYFGDLIRQATGETATAIIRNFVMQRATAYLHDGKTISETSEILGFEYPQHFTRVFKKHFGLTPREFLRK